MQNINISERMFASTEAVSAPERLRRCIDTKFVPWVATLSPLIWFVLICIWLYTAVCGLVGGVVAPR